MTKTIPNIGIGGGQFWYGSHGFLYKKKAGGGARKNPPYGLICNQPQNIYNKYTPGAGVGANSVATRRSKMRLATSCNTNQQCGRFYQYLGENTITPSQYTRYTNIPSNIQVSHKNEFLNSSSQNIFGNIPGLFME